MPMLRERGEEKANYRWYICPECESYKHHFSMLRSIPYCDDCHVPMKPAPDVEAA